MDTISVVMPAYNAAGTIRVALDSIASQSRQPDEIIVVDDGSTDDTSAVVREWSPDVHLIQQVNGGAGAARRVGTATAKGDLVAYLDADDWWDLEWLRKAAGIFESGPVHLLVADLARAVPGSSREEWLPANRDHFPWGPEFLKAKGVETDPSGRLFCLSSEASIELLLRGYPVFPSCTVVRRSTALEVGNWDPQFRRAQDLDFALRIARRYPTRWLVETVAVLGLHSGNNDWKDYSIKQMTGVIEVLSATFEQTRMEAGSRSFRRRLSRALAEKYCGLGWLYGKNGKPEQAFQCYRAAMRFEGRRLHASVRSLAMGLRALVG